jgi:cytochrome c556
MRHALFGLITAAACAAGSVAAQEQTHAEKPTLRVIMQELQVEFLKMTNALVIDDFATLAEAAKAVQGHPMPDEIVAAIKQKLGRNFAGFEKTDQQGHQAAGDLARRAAAKDAAGSAKAFGRLTESCVSCHKQYRAVLKPLSD